MLSKCLLMVFLKTVFSILVVGVLVSKDSACNTGDLDMIPGLGRSSGEGNGSPLQYSCLENPMERGDWQATQSMGLQVAGHN